MALIHSLLMGAVAGMRAMTPLAAVTNAARLGALPVGNGAPRLLSNRLAAHGAIAIAGRELVGDKQRSAPDRIAPAGLAARIATGAIAGAALAPRRQRAAAAALGAAAAVGTAYLAFALRKRATARYGQVATGAVEDAVTLAGAALVVASASRRSRRRR